MGRWSTNDTEYNHAREIALAAMPGPATVVMKDSTRIEGYVTGQSFGTDVGENILSGKGPYVTATRGDVRFTDADGQEYTLDVLDIRSITKS